MRELTCSVNGCVGPHSRISSGMCSKHYQRLRTHGTTADRPPRRWVICNHAACSRQARSDGFCSSHANGANADQGFSRRHVRTGVDRFRHYCSFADCNRPHKVRGLCHTHNQQAAEPNADASQCVRSGCSRAAFSRGVCVRHLHFRYMNLRQYNMTIDQYDAMFAAQGGCCAICGGKNANGNWLAVDHNHGCCPSKSTSCGQCIRALLCGKCNLMIGQSGDDADRLRAGAAYLESRRM